MGRRSCLREAHRWIWLALTAILVMLGAPFWFDLLGKLVSVRGTGTEPDSVEVDAASATPPLRQRSLPPRWQANTLLERRQPGSPRPARHLGSSHSWLD